MRGDVKKLIEDGMKSQENYKSGVTEVEGLHVGIQSQAMMDVEDPTEVRKARDVNRLRTKQSNEEMLRRMAKGRVKIQTPIGFDSEGEVIKNPSVRSRGVTSFGGKNASIFFEEKNPTTKPKKPKEDKPIIHKEQASREELKKKIAAPADKMTSFAGKNAALMLENQRNNKKISGKPLPKSTDAAKFAGSNAIFFFKNP